LCLHFVGRRCFYSSIIQSDPGGEHSIIASSRLFALTMIMYGSPPSLPQTQLYSFVQEQSVKVNRAISSNRYFIPEI
jgi:hypothetical protein